MTQKFYRQSVANGGLYIGSFDQIERHVEDKNGNPVSVFEGAEPPVGSVEIPSPPPHGTSKWDGVQWLDLRPYDELRRAEYPNMGDQLDALWKQLNQDRLGGKALIQAADDQLNAILAVKAKYPKGV